MKMIRYGGPITRVRPVGSPIGYGGSAPPAGSQFLDWDDARVGSSGVVDKWSGTSGVVGEQGVGQTSPGGNAPISYTSAGFKPKNATGVDTTQSAINYSSAALLALLPNLAATGYTLQYEIEPHIFLDTYVFPSEYDQPTTLFHSGGSASNNALNFGVKAASKWRYTTATQPNVNTIWTGNDANDNTHDLITVSIQGTDGPTPGQTDIYRNKTLISSFVNDTPSATTLLYIGGQGAFLSVAPYCPDAYIRNVLLIEGPLVPAVNYIAAVLGDSNVTYSQYMATGGAPPNYPAIQGYVGPPDYPTGTCGAVSSPDNELTDFDRCLFPLIHGGLANKKTFLDPQLLSYGRVGCRIIYRGYGEEYGTLANRVDSVLQVQTTAEPLLITDNRRATADT
jgi:hypothetical protein